MHIANFSSNFYTPTLQAVNFNNKVAAGLPDRKFIKQTKLITMHPDLDKEFGKAAKVYEITVDEQLFKQACVEMMKKYIDMMMLRLKQEHK